MKIIIFNGPPGCGKDTAAHVLYHQFYNRVPLFERFSMPFKRAFACVVNAHIDKFGHVTGYEEHKEEVIPLLGVSYRQWQIDFSEKFMKPLYGVRIFGDLMVERLKYSGAKLVLIPDCGFQPELDQLEAAYGIQSVLLVRIHRPNRTFDSRGWVNGANMIEIANHDSVEAFRRDVIKMVAPFIEA